MVPFAFRPFARAMVERIEGSPSLVLDLASGTGILGRELVARLPSATVVSADTSVSMLQACASNDTLPDACGKPQPIPQKSIRVRADASTLPFRSESFDVVGCGFGAMFFPDKVHAFGEARRVLKPGGQFLSTSWAAISENPVMELIEQVARSFLTDSNEPLFAVPFSYWNCDQIAEDLIDAGFKKVKVEELKIASGSCSAEDVVRGFLEGNPIVKRFLEPPDLLAHLRKVAIERVTAEFGDDVRVELAGTIFGGIK